MARPLARSRVRCRRLRDRHRGQRTQQAHEASQTLADTGDERGAEAGERFVSNASGILTELSNFIEDVKVSLAGEAR